MPTGAATESPASTVAPPGSIEYVRELAGKLTRQDKLQLIADLARQLLGETQPAPAKKPFQSFYGIMAHISPVPSAEDIDETRREAWANFPREEFYE